MKLHVEFSFIYGISINFFHVQKLLLQDLVFLFRNGNGNIQNATREALLRIKVTFSISCAVIKDEKIVKYLVWVVTKATNSGEILITPFLLFVNQLFIDFFVS